MESFETWSDVIAFMRRGTSTDPRKSDILKCILMSHGREQDPLWLVVLLAIFWPGLLALRRKRRRWDPDDPEELMQRIFLAFLEVVCRIDPDVDDDRLVQRLYNRTCDRVHEEYRRAWRRAKHEVETDPALLDEVGSGGRRTSCDQDIDLLAERDRGIKRLRKCRDAGQITEADFLLGVGCLVYHRPVADFARQAGLGYESAKKRHQRLQAKLRRLEDAAR